MCLMGMLSFVVDDSELLPVLVHDATGPAAEEVRTTVS